MDKNNSVFLRGRVVDNAELSETKNGSPLCEFALAVLKNGGAESIINLSISGLAAKGFYRALKKGRLAAVSGSLGQSVYEREYKTSTWLRVFVDDIQFEDGGAEGSEEVEFVEFADDFANESAPDDGIPF
jgi:single-stranded DNA-binding protein